MRYQSLFWHYRKCSQLDIERRVQQQQDRRQGLQQRALLQHVTVEVLPILNVRGGHYDADGWRDGQLPVHLPL